MGWVGMGNWFVIYCCFQAPVHKLQKLFHFNWFVKWAKLNCTELAAGSSRRVQNDLMFLLSCQKKAMHLRSEDPPGAASSEYLSDAARVSLGKTTCQSVNQERSVPTRFALCPLVGDSISAWNRLPWPQTSLHCVWSTCSHVTSTQNVRSLFSLFFPSLPEWFYRNRNGFYTE